MRLIKRGMSAFLVTIFLIPQCLVVSASELKSNEAGEKYEKKVISSISRERFSDGNRKFTDNDEKLTAEELILLEQSYKEKQSYEVLVPKTESKYEVTLSYEDGTYEYIGSADTYDEAVAMADEKQNGLRRQRSSEVVVPTVINEEGITVYATLSIARAWKENATSAGTTLSYVYSNSSLTSAYTYIHDGYISEMPIIQENENEAKVLVAGYEGWLNKNPDRTAAGYSGPNKDIRIQPITDVTNPCYYTVSSGLLVHYISTSMTGSGLSKRTIGVAPSYLKEGQRYYSYDGTYFYDGSQGIATGLSNLTMDLQAGSHGRAVNANDPYYNYYSYLPFRTKTNYTAEEIDSYINAKTISTSKLRGLGQALINAQETYGVNALLTLGVAMNESAMGTSNYAMERNNLFGLNATDDNTNANTSYYSSPEASVIEFAKTYISRGYADPRNWTFYGGYLGNKKYGANVKYASDPYWSEKAVSYAFDVEAYLSGGNVNNMKDYNYYQLLMYNGTSNVVTAQGATLYPVQSSINSSSTNIGAVVAYSGGALTNINGANHYEVYAERTTSISSGRFGGVYDWNTKGYVNTDKVKLINSGGNWFKAEDFNMDAKVDAMDLAILGQEYNKVSSSSGWNSKYDINGDGIIDIYDVVKLSSKI